MPARSRGAYGAPRVCTTLSAEGQHVACQRVARLRRGASLSG
ncbi:MAG: hypothetical protein HY689_06820 [Chloroflexi bacterium]|nr:hypothetical protein [Chloroflexota bacterium]